MGDCSPGTVVVAMTCVTTEETHKDKGAAGTDAPAAGEVDKVIKMKGSIHVGPFQAEILEGRVAHEHPHMIPM